jgi:RHS repeat-associated protein
MKKLLLLAVLLLTPLLFSQMQVFHDTQGKFDVSQSGQATYTLPIAMPPSIQDVGPTINLVYASGQMGGIAGQGWNISAISNISRIATRKDIDGFVDGVDFDDNDKLALDGQRLLLKTGTYWAAGSTYETEVQSNTKVELVGSGTTLTFVVTTPDGSKSYYGGIGFTDLTAYYISRFEDTKGNFITYEYNVNSPNAIAPRSYTVQQPYGNSHEIFGYHTVTVSVPGVNSANSLTIKQINFSANTISNAIPLNAIKFTYKAASRSEEAYIKGEAIKKIDILDKIEVLTNEAVFKTYKLTHTADNLGYERLTRLQEFSGADLVGANPVLFEYGNTSDGINYQDVYVNTSAAGTSTLSLINPTLTGDFTGEGSLDFVKDNVMYPNPFLGSLPISPLSYNCAAGKTFSVNTLNGSHFEQRNTILTIEENGSNLTLNDHRLNQAFTKTVSLDLPIPNFTNNCSPTSVGWNGSLDHTNKEYLTGDFNGDGISELLIKGKNVDTATFEDQPVFYNDENGDPIYDHTECVATSLIYSNFLRMVDLNPNVPTTDNTVGNTLVDNTLWYGEGRKFVYDFNNDGKDEIMSINDNTYYMIYSFKTQLVAPFITMEVIGQGYLISYNPNLPLLFGDFNGDSKIDMMQPLALESANWLLFTGNPKPLGGDFFERQVVGTDLIYRPYDSGGYWQDWHQYLAVDVNKDGKTDLIDFKATSYYEDDFWGDREWFSGWQIKQYVKSGNYFSFIHDSGEVNTSGSHIPQLVATNQRTNNTDHDLLIIHTPDPTQSWDKLTYIDFAKNIAKDNNLVKVMQSNSQIIDEIEYKDLDNTIEVNQTAQTTFYSCKDTYSPNPVYYPNTELKRIPSCKLVSKLKNTTMGIARFQDFKYRGMTVNYTGIGTIGFSSTARSSWYRTSSDKKIWNVFINDNLKRGANVRSYSKMLDGSTAFAFNDYTNLLSDNTNVFNTPAATFPYTLLLNSQSSTDYMTNVRTEKTLGYSADGYNLPTTTTTNTYLGTTLQSTSSSDAHFLNNPTGTGSNYYIGRPDWSTSTTTAYNDTKSSYQKLTYTGSNVTQTEKKVGTTAANAVAATEKIVETMVYFPNGNLQSKSINAVGFSATAMANIVPRATSYTYDTTNRFVKTSTDIEQLVTTNNTYHPLYGTVTSQTNPFNQTTLSTYDSWGKRTLITDFLGKTLTYAYTRTNNEYTTQETGADGSSSKTISDALGRVIKKGGKDVTGNWNFSNTLYDWKGQAISQSEPYLEGTTPVKFTVSAYDDYGRTSVVTEHTGKITNFSYNGLTTTVADTQKTSTKTLNANGHTVSTSDTAVGEATSTINYTYNANGNMLTSDYGGIGLAMTYDLWGRKTQQIDPTAGQYNYTYNAFGELLTEQTPKMLTTIVLNTVGKPMTKQVTGLADNPTLTNILSTYSYDPTRKWLTNIAVTNPNDGNSTYTYTYDTTAISPLLPTYQLKQTVENQTGLVVTFTKTLAFDSYGRTQTETNTATAGGKTSTKTTFNEYQNGALYRLRDTNATGTIIWQTNSANPRGQVTGASMNVGANTINIANQYDAYGYSKQIKHNKAGTSLMTLDYTFADPARGNLTTRTNSMFNSYENFEYDTQDRLTKWSSRTNTLQNFTFATGVEGFTAKQGSNMCYGTAINPGTTTVANPSGLLQVNAQGDNAGVEKQILTNAPAGKVIDITGTLNFMLPTQSQCQLYLQICEKDPVTGNQIRTQQFNYMSSGDFNLSYTTQNVSNVFLQFMITFSGYYNPCPLITLTFTADNIKVFEKQVNTQAYDNRGRITDNELGNYRYPTTGKIYQNDKIKLTAEAQTYYNDTNYQSQTITYNGFKSPIQIIENGKESISFGYNAMQQRSVMYYGDTNTNKLLRPYRKYYSADGSMEIKHTLATATAIASYEFVTYLGGDAYSAPALAKQINSGTNAVFYLHRDYQSTILAVSNSLGVVIEKRHFDPWGSLIKLEQNGVAVVAPYTGVTLFTDRGYTGHEHLLKIGLINMNARLYDPKLHRFLQADSEPQNAADAQNYNRYNYCGGNPLKFTDPSGNNPIIIGVAIGLAYYFADAIINHKPINLGGIMQTVVMSAFSSGVAFGIGEMTGTMFKALSTTCQQVARGAVQALAHGTFQGGMSAIQGGNFWNGAAAGALSSIAASTWPAVGGKFAKSGVGMIAFGTIAGGAGAALTGGNFWQGAVTGLIVSGLNHAMHQMDFEGSEEGDPTPKGKGGKPSNTPPPKKLPGFPDAERMKPKGTSKRWRLPDGDIVEWDRSHGGELERYNPRGKHVGVWSPDGQQIKDPVPGRTITPYATPNFGTGVAVGVGFIATYEVVKYTIAILGVPETGGASLLLLATP